MQSIAMEIRKVFDEDGIPICLFGASQNRTMVVPFLNAKYKHKKG